MLSVRASRGTFLWTAGLAAGTLAFALAGQGCALLVCYDGDPGCAQASAGAGGGGTSTSATSAGGTGGTTATASGGMGGTASTGGTGGSPCELGDVGDPTSCGGAKIDCHGGECCGGVCQPVVVALPLDQKGRYLATGPQRLYMGTWGPLATQAQVHEIPMEALGDIASGAASLSAQTQLAIPVDGDPVPSGTGGMVGRVEEVFLSTAGSANFVRCSFDSNTWESFGGQNGAGLALHADTLYATYHGNTTLYAYDAAMPTGSMTTTSAPSNRAAGGFAVSATSEHVVWSLTGLKGNVAGTNPDATCGPHILETPIAYPTGIAVDSGAGSLGAPVFVLTEPSNGAATLLRLEIATGDCVPGAPELMVTLHPRKGQHGIAIDDKYVYVVDAGEDAVDPANPQDATRVLACNRTTLNGNTMTDCKVVVELNEPVRGLATGDGLVYYLSETHVGWRNPKVLSP